MKSYVLGVSVFLACGLSSAFGYDWGGNPGDGSMANPYQISSPEQLLAVPLGGNTADHHYVLVSDIVFDPENPGHRLSSGLPSLECQFDGAGFAIRNLTIQTTTAKETVGLFSRVGPLSRVKNLTLLNASIEIGASANNVGLLCGELNGDVFNCTVEGTLTGPMKNGGGICGLAYGGRLHRTRTTCRIVGGQGGGGVAGRVVESQVLFCESEFHFQTNHPAYDVGGIAGFVSNYSCVFGCTAQVDIVCHSRLSNAGGIVGRSGSNYLDYDGIFNSSATGNIYGQSINYGGGAVGRSQITLKHSYAHVDIEAGPGDEMSRNAWIGGFVGYHEGSYVIEHCYSTGRITIASAPTFWPGTFGGFCGAAGVNLFNCFWNTETSGYATGVGSQDRPGVTGLTTGQMQTRATFEQAGWDFAVEPVWGIKADSYPHLVFKTFSGGSGWEFDPFLIASAEDLIELGQSRRYYGDCYALSCDIDLSDYVFSNSVIAPAEHPYLFDMYFDTPIFFGVLNGRGYGIYNLHIKSDGAQKWPCLGLFGGLSGRVYNLRLENAIIENSGPEKYVVAGILCGVNMGHIDRCRVTGRVTIEGVLGAMGGVSGELYSGRITHSYFEGQVNGDFTGGIVGDVGKGIVDGCYAVCEVEGYFRGGVAGAIGRGIIQNSAWDSELSGVGSGCGYIYGPEPDQCVINVKGLTGAEMKTAAAFADLGWRFVGAGDGGKQVWRMCVDGVDLPRLSWEFARDGDFACPDGVNVEDLDFYAARWLMEGCASSNHYCGGADLDYSGVVDMADLTIFAGHWLSE